MAARPEETSEESIRARFIKYFKGNTGEPRLLKKNVGGYDQSIFR